MGEVIEMSGGPRPLNPPHLPDISSSEAFDLQKLTVSILTC